MPRKIVYTYKNEQKTISFSFDKYRDMFEAVAAAEDLDIQKFLSMEQALEYTTRDKSALRNFRQAEIKRLGFTQLEWLKEDDE
ncbi:DUF2960 family protein [Catenovulum sp. SM1970]|uniref:DUF2960 family protein n=1 Tax=Marinifaba aquimaris TaxID=2741323 RepID=UPI00157305EE|nr:DUF2960 family protein [Marinifaba aquimaris]NTS78559.1 DUF2960 family protein [Marinifaba aquimaris]